MGFIKKLFMAKDLQNNSASKLEYKILTGLIFVALILPILLNIEAIAGNYSEAFHMLFHRLEGVYLFSKYTNVMSITLFAVISVRYTKRPKCIFWIAFFAIILLSNLPNILNYTSKMYSNTIINDYLIAATFILLKPISIFCLMTLILPMLKKSKYNSLTLIILSFFIILLVNISMSILAFYLTELFNSHKPNFDFADYINIIIARESDPLLKSILLFIIILPLEIFIFKQPPYKKNKQEQIAENQNSAPTALPITDDSIAEVEIDVVNVEYSNKSLNGD